MAKSLVLKLGSSLHRLTRSIWQATVLLLLVGTAGCGQAATNAAPKSPRPFTVHEVARFSSPWAIAFLPGPGDRLTDRALVTEKAGKLWLVDSRTGAKTAVAGVPTVKAGGQGGLLDVVAAPGFASDHRIYLTYSEPSVQGGSGLALTRATLVPGAKPRLDGAQVIWRDPAGGRGGQFGGIVVFAPDGRSLFLSAGERQRFTPAQDPNQPTGKILHLTLDGKPAAGNPAAGMLGVRTVTITDPPDDTVAAKTTRGRTFAWPGPNNTPAETWSSGHRNPYGLAFDATGRLWETEMGPKGGDELNLILPGRNYGWPEVSDGQNYDGVPIPAHSTQPKFEASKLSWVPSISPTSLLIYSGSRFPQWNGSGLIGALSGQALIRVDLSGSEARKLEQWDMGARIRFVSQGPDGAVYLLEDEGRLLRLDPAKS